MEQQKINEYKQLPVGTTAQECQKNIQAGLLQLKKLFSDITKNENQRNIS